MPTVDYQQFNHRVPRKKPAPPSSKYQRRTEHLHYFLFDFIGKFCGHRAAQLPPEHSYPWLGVFPSQPRPNISNSVVHNSVRVKEEVQISKYPILYSPTTSFVQFVSSCLRAFLWIKYGVHCQIAAGTPRTLVLQYTCIRTRYSNKDKNWRCGLCLCLYLCSVVLYDACRVAS